MPAPKLYVTSSIAYVNGAPHLGHALELVQADVLARHARRRSRPVRALTGTDEHSLNCVRAAAAAGLPTAALVARNAARFQALQEQLELSFDDFLRTSADPRHRPAVERLWAALAANGDLYRRRYEGRYCDGCERFYTPDELVDGRCPEHGTVPAVASEENWFFRLSRYTGRLVDLLERGRLQVDPPERRNEALAFVKAGLDDLNVSRDRARSGGWGIPVPGDPSQVVYVWLDALANYISALGYGAGATVPATPGTEASGEIDGAGPAAYRAWWSGSEVERVHVIGKGILRFHAVYWPAFLLAAGEPPPDRIVVHDYVTAGGAKLSKSAGNVVDPAALVARFGVDAVRWWLVREPPPVGDVDFTLDRLADRYDADLAGGIGNLVNRTVALVWRHHDGQVPPLPAAAPEAAAVVPARAAAAALAAARRRLPGLVDARLAAFDLRGATGALLGLVGEANRYVEASRPWELARPGADRQAGAAALGLLVATCREIAAELAPFLPGAAARLSAQLGDGGPRLRSPQAPFPRLAEG